MNHHFGEMGDVWKHLPLAEMLRVNPPLHYWETHAGSARYPLTASPTRRHGVLRFLELAPGDPELQGCAYLGALRLMPGYYPGSPALATQVLGRDGSYIFCDIDPESAAGLRTAAGGLEARVIEADGVSAIAREAELERVDPAEVLVLVDPFDPHQRWTPGGQTPLELAGWLAGEGYRVVFWYCYDSVEQRGWARAELGRLAPGAGLWCGDAMMPASFAWAGKPGPWGCGIVLANATSAEVSACERLGRALQRISEDDVVGGNEPDRLQFQVVQ